LVHYLAGGLTTGVIAHTKVANIPAAHVHRPVCFIPHSVDIRSLTRSSHEPLSGTVRILMVAQYIPRKGHDLLAKALRILIDRGRENFELRLVGTQDPTWLESVISAEGLQKFVTLCGVLKGEDLYSEFSKADIFVLTSRFDTFAVVVHEAAAFGLPLLISKHAESSSLLVVERINGFVIDPYDSETLADRFEYLIDRPDIRQEMGRESRKIGEELCASKMGVRLANWLLEHARKFHSS
jgi:glycosyltransferase involved in cell wall biosynthesis